MTIEQSCQQKASVLFHTNMSHCDDVVELVQFACYLIGPFLRQSYSIRQKSKWAFPFQLYPITGKITRLVSLYERRWQYNIYWQCTRQVSLYYHASEFKSLLTIKLTLKCCFFHKSDSSGCKNGTTWRGWRGGYQSLVDTYPFFMLRRMSEVKRKDRIRNEYIGGSGKVT